MLLPPGHEKAELIEVVRITDPTRHLGSHDLTGEEVALWAAPQVERIVGLIRSLPGSELHRCFVPGWGIRMHSGSDHLLQIAFCFRCHGARVWGPIVPAGRKAISGFDPDSPPGRELLEAFRDAGRGKRTGA
ncbi:hypothetical protein [Streptomyces sp. NPDC048560]|uniref:hypothetical protein n=1 Tax=Streptomyces sp. NPDC048560 TaxID=3155488 RepID=UPI00343DB6C4